METNVPSIQIKDLYKSFDKNQVLKGISITVNKGEVVVILGRSGSGKSVIIKCIVGLLTIDAGSIQILGTEITSLTMKGLNAIRAHIGFLFQNGALYDSMSVKENLTFALKHHDKYSTKESTNEAIKKVLESVGLLDALNNKPSSLSGGMRKRVGLARTLITQPEIILYDEPTSGLDTITAREITDLIGTIHNQYHTTSIIITHDMACAKHHGKRIIILKDGKIKAEGSYAELEKSKDEWVQLFFI